MSSIINCSKLLAAAVCGGVLLAGCNSVEDVRDPPFTPVPAQKAVLAGTITGLGNSRPVVLRWRGTPACKAPSSTDPTKFVDADCKFYGIQGAQESNFNFGAEQDVGTPYTITVVSSPYGKTCVPKAGTDTGTVGSGVVPVVECTNNLAVVPRYDLTVTVPLALQSLANLEISLTTEEKQETKNATALASVTFPGVLFNSGTSLPLFEYKLIATTRTPDGTVNRCTFTPATGPAAGFNLGGENRNPIGSFTDTITDNDIVLPTGPTTVSLGACTFSVTATVAYNGTPSLAIPGLTLALRRSLAGMLATEDVQTLVVPAVASGTTTVTFPTPVMANDNAVYDLVVTAQPAGQVCVVSGTTTTYADTSSPTAGLNTAITAPTGSAVLLVDPSNTDWWAFQNRSVRCRAKPALADRLIGTYQMDARTGFQTGVTPNLEYGRPREFLTFFADGTFLFGIDATATASRNSGSPNATWPATTAPRAPANWAAASGVNHGFYAYNSAAGTITFTVLTATNINNGGRGISAMAGAAAPPTFIPAIVATNVVKGTVPDPALGLLPGVGNLGTLSMTFATALPGGTRLWTMTEPSSRPGEVMGTWVTADHRRVFVHNAGDTFTYHGGVNGMGNLQDVCMLPDDDSTQSVGTLTAHGGSAAAGFLFTCLLGVVNPCPTGYTCPTAFDRFASTPDLPDTRPKNSPPDFLGIGPTTPRLAPGFIGRFPGTKSQLELNSRPTSPTLYNVDTDTLTVKNTLNGVVDQPIVTFVRERTTSPTGP